MIQYNRINLNMNIKKKMFRTIENVSSKFHTRNSFNFKLTKS